MKSILLVVLLSAAANAFLFDSSWNGLRVKWGINPFKSFESVPRTLEENQGQFDLKDDLCAAGGKFVGQRYWYKQDPALILVFDKNGIIAGIQTSAPKAKFTPEGHLAKYYIDDGEYWTLAAYFVDPSTVCTTGRTKDDLDTQGTGTGLWLQYGPNPVSDSVNIPTSEDDIKKTKWGYGKCFPTMGQHYWYNVSKSMECDDFIPNCLLYNKHKLTGFCFATNGILDSERYDNPAPTNQVVNKFLDPVPDCFFSDPSYATLSTLHVYFNDKPQLSSFC